MSSLKQVSTREAARYLIDNGFRLDRTKGDHFIYKRGTDTVTINRNLNKMVWRRLVKTYNIQVNYEHKIKM